MTDPIQNLIDVAKTQLCSEYCTLPGRGCCKPGLVEAIKAAVKQHEENGMKLLDLIRRALRPEPKSQAYNFGWAARIHGTTRNNSPYLIETEKADWLKGWDDADDCIERNAW